VVGDVTGSGMEGEEEAARRRGGGDQPTTRGYRNVSVHVPLPRGKKYWEVGDGRSWPSDLRGAVRPRRREITAVRVVGVHRDGLVVKSAGRNGSWAEC